MKPSWRAILICTGLLVLSSTAPLEGQKNRLRLASDDEIGYTQYDQRILELERVAIENAFNEQIVHLYQTWMKDDTGQPERAGKGAAQARRAYIRSMSAIEQRKQKIELLGTLKSNGTK